MALTKQYVRDGKRQIIGSVWARTERRLYTDLFSEYFSFGIMMMPIQN
jgi:hypothetical protein